MHSIKRNNQILTIRLEKYYKSDPSNPSINTIIGDFDFYITKDMFKENSILFPHLYATIINEKKYTMGISLSHYKVSDDIEFFITHPNFSVEDI